MKTLFILAGVVVVLFLVAPNKVEAQKRLYVAPDGEFSYSPPAGWVLRDVPQLKFKGAFGQKSNDGSELSIVIFDESFSRTLDGYVAAKLPSLPSVAAKNGFKNFRVLSQSEFITDARQRGIKIITQFQWGEKWVRQTSYLFDGKNGKKFEFNCSRVVTPGGEAYDKIFEQSMKTFKAPA